MDTVSLIQYPIVFRFIQSCVQTVAALYGFFLALLVYPEVQRKGQAEVDAIVGLDRFKVIHCNDSKKSLGAKVDRHEHLGEGQIGEEAFRLLVNDPRFYQVPIILETPEPKLMHEKNLKKLRSLVKNP